MTVKHDVCAELLQYFLISDSSRYAHFIDSEGLIRTFDSATCTPDSPFRKVQANGAGKFCRWMLTDDALVVRFLDGSYWAKSRPENLFKGGGNYQPVFSFDGDAEDLIVLNTPMRTYVLRVTNGKVEEESFETEGHLFCGLTLGDLTYALFGQTNRFVSKVAGHPLAVWFGRSGTVVRSASMEAESGVEGVVGVLDCSGATILICSRLQPVIELEFEDIPDSPGSNDHEDFCVARGPSPEIRMETYIERARFLGTIGPKNKHAAYFENREKKLGSAAMICVSTDGSIKYLDIKGLGFNFNIIKVQYYLAFGWLGLAEEHNDTFDQWLLFSDDGLEWDAKKIKP